MQITAKVKLELYEASFLEEKIFFLLKHSLEHLHW